MSDGAKFELDCADARIRKLEAELEAAKARVKALEQVDFVMASQEKRKAIQARLANLHAEDKELEITLRVMEQYENQIRAEGAGASQNNP